MFAMAILGSLEYFRGNAGPGIGLAIVTELFLGFAYARLWRYNSKL